MFHNKKEATATCIQCGHIFLRATGKLVAVITVMGVHEKVMFCRAHWPAYDGYFENSYWRDHVPCDVNGVPIGYTPAPKAETS